MRTLLGNDTYMLNRLQIEQMLILPRVVEIRGGCWKPTPSKAGRAFFRQRYSTRPSSFHMHFRTICCIFRVSIITISALGNILGDILKTETSAKLKHNFDGSRRILTQRSSSFIDTYTETGQ